MLNAGESERSPEGTAMQAASSRLHIANRAGSGAAQRSARMRFDQRQGVGMGTSSQAGGMSTVPKSAGDTISKYSMSGE